MIRQLSTRERISANIDAGSETMPVRDHLDQFVFDSGIGHSRNEMNGTTRFVSLLTRVDGAIVLDPRLSVVGFGVDDRRAEC